MNPTTTTRPKTRSRNACSTCRKSRVKCDESKPVCTRCWQKDLPCKWETPLKWESDFHSRGIAFGRAGVWGKRSSKKSSPSPEAQENNVYCDTPAIQPWSFVNTNITLLNRLYDTETSPREPLLLPASDVVGYTDGVYTISSPAQAQSPLHRPLPLFPNLTTTNHDLFDYYIHHICPRTVTSLTSPSPFASTLLPYCLSASPTVLTSIQALGACHRAQSVPSHKPTALRLKSRVLRDLQQKLALGHDFILSPDPEVLVITMMLCLYEIVDNCDQRWIVHLQGAKDMIRLRRKKGGTQQDEVSSFAELFFAFQDVMGRTACAKADLFGPSYWKESDRAVHGWMGCSPELVSVLFAIMDLSKTRREVVSDADQIGFNIKAAMLNRRLGDVVQTLEDPGDEVLGSVAELKKLACTVYLHCALHSATPSTLLVRNYVREILKRISTLLHQGTAINAMWPIFVAAVELDPLHDELWVDTETGPVYGRALVLQALTAMAQSSVSSVSRTRAVIEKVWQARDFDLGSERGVVSGWNDWEWYVVPVSDALSLV